MGERKKLRYITQNVARLMQKLGDIEEDDNVRDYEQPAAITICQ